MKKCRIKITLDCNRKCQFCINNDKAYRERWIKVKELQEIPLESYGSVIVSGGEPTLVQSLTLLLRRMRARTDEPIYLQTNGLHLTKEMVKQIDNEIDGIGISVYDTKMHMLQRWRDILKVKPIQLYIQDTLYECMAYPPDQLRAMGFSVRIWRAGEYSKNEDVYVLGHSD